MRVPCTTRAPTGKWTPATTLGHRTMAFKEAQVRPRVRYRACQCVRRPLAHDKAPMYAPD